MKGKRHIDWLSLTVTLLPVVPIAFDVWGIVYYRQGLRNEPMNLAPCVMAVAIVTSFCIAILLVRTWTLHQHGDPRAMLCWFMFALALMVWPAVLIWQPRPIEIYVRGLGDWARNTVDVEAIRKWRASSPDRSPSDEISKLNPLRIDHHPTGVVLQWGQFSLIPGKLRKLFVGDDPNSQPPDEGRYFWRNVSPGVFVGAHGER